MGITAIGDGSPFRLLLIGVCLAFCFIPSIIFFVIGLSIYFTSPYKDSINTPTVCTLTSNIHCILSSQSTFVNNNFLDDSVNYLLNGIINFNNNNSSKTASCTFSVRYKTQNGKTIDSSAVPFPIHSIYSQYQMGQQVKCYYDITKPLNVSFTKITFLHYYTILGLAIIGISSLLLLFVFFCLCIFSINLVVFCLKFFHERRKREWKRDLENEVKRNKSFYYGLNNSELIRDDKAINNVEGSGEDDEDNAWMLGSSSLLASQVQLMTKHKLKGSKSGKSGVGTKGISSFLRSSSSNNSGSYSPVRKSPMKSSKSWFVIGENGFEEDSEDESVEDVRIEIDKN
ncbi:hypothetical protein ABK040_002762 [Willaertia magna]